MIKLFKELIKEHPEIWTEEFKASIYQTCRDMVDLEDRFIDLAFQMGGIRGLKAEEVKQYIRYIADRRLLQLSLKPNYGVKDNPLGWLDWVLNGVEHANFFENRATEYNKGTVSGSLWG
jgi:ribonucleoside-diphosphate reductase beta chain